MGKRVGIPRYFRRAFWIAVSVVGGLAVVSCLAGAGLVEPGSSPTVTPVPHATEPRDTSGHPFCGDLRYSEITDDRIVFDEGNYCSYRLVDLDETDEFTALIVRAKHLIQFSKEVEIYDCVSDVREGYLEREHEHIYYTEDGAFIACGIAE